MHMNCDLFRHLFGNFEDYSIERRDISPREGYLLERSLVWLKNKLLLPLYLNHSFFWADPVGYLNHDLLVRPIQLEGRFLVEQEKEAFIDKFVKARRNQYDLTAEDWFAFAETIDPVPSVYDLSLADYRMSKEEKERIAWQMEKGVGISEWCQWFIRISDEEPSALKVRVVGYSKGDIYIGSGFYYADIKESNWLDHMDNELLINDEYLKEGSDGVAIASRLLKWMRSDIQFEGMPLEHLVVFLNQKDSNTIRKCIPEEHRNRFIWLGELLEQIIQDPQLRARVKADWCDIRDFVIKRYLEEEILLRRRVTSPNMHIEVQRYVTKAEENIHSASSSYQSHHFTPCSSLAFESIEFLIKASAIQDRLLLTQEGEVDVESIKNKKFFDIFNLVRSNGRLFKPSTEWPQLRCESLAHQISLEYHDRSPVKHDTTKHSEEVATQVLRLAEHLLDKFSRTY